MVSARFAARCWESPICMEKRRKRAIRRRVPQQLRKERSASQSTDCCTVDEQQSRRENVASKIAAQTAAQGLPGTTQNAPKPLHGALYFTTTYARLGLFVIGRSSVQVRSSAPFFSEAYESVHRNLLHICCTNNFFCQTLHRLGHHARHRLDVTPLRRCNDRIDLGVKFPMAMPA